MPRRKNIDPTVFLNLGLPASIKTRLDLLLYSELEKRIPQGKYQEFFIARIQEFFSHRRLELVQYGFAPGYYVVGPKPILDALEQRLKESSDDRK